MDIAWLPFNLYDALGVDVRRMTGTERAAVRESLRDGGNG